MSAPAVLILARDNHGTLAHVLAEIPEALHGGVIVVDDGSDPPLQAPGFMVARHASPRGLGAALKTGMAIAMASDVERIVTLHADRRCDTSAALALADGLEHGHGLARGQHGVDLVLGHEQGAADRLDIALARLANRRLHANLSVYHGVTISYRVDALRGVHLERLPDDDRFELALITSLLARGLRAAEVPLPRRASRTPSEGGAARARRLIEELQMLAWPPG